MLAKRIIPCLDMKNGKVVKGVQFKDVRDVGDPPKMALEYEKQGADEIVFLDISASLEARTTMIDVVSKTVKNISIPLCLGGGIKSTEDMGLALNAGADKVSINSSAISDPDIISDCVEKFGKKRVVVAIDAKRNGNEWEVYTHGGTRGTGLDVVAWSIKAADLGAGEILLTSMDVDGEKTGYDIPLTAAVSEAVSVPVIASGGCGSIEHIYEVLTQTDAAAALAASVFHYKQFTVSEVKEYLRDKGVVIK
jgi:cyclase